MSDNIDNRIKDRLELALNKPVQDQLNLAKEVLQEVILCALYRVGFFNVSSFVGGTALRILHGLNRFSEDLDFSVVQPVDTEELEAKVGEIISFCESLNLVIEITYRRAEKTSLLSVSVKESAIVQFLGQRIPLHKGQKIRVKIEIDMNPPLGAETEIRSLSYPESSQIRTHTLPSLFAGKLNAILTRPWEKGRDWYDLLFFFEQEIQPNFELLYNSLQQFKVFEGNLPAQLDLPWVGDMLAQRISELSVLNLKNDVTPFLEDMSIVNDWSEGFFKKRINKFVQG